MDMNITEIIRLANKYGPKVSAAVNVARSIRNIFAKRKTGELKAQDFDAAVLDVEGFAEILAGKDLINGQVAVEQAAEVRQIVADIREASYLVMKQEEKLLSLYARLEQLKGTGLVLPGTGV